MSYTSIPKQTLLRLPTYLTVLKKLEKEGRQDISATIIAEMLKLNHVQVRKDLASVSTGGRPKTGYNVQKLTAEIESFLGYDNINNAVLIGAGNLGKALLFYNGFQNFGLEILAAFDVDESCTGTKINGKTIFPMEKLENLCKRMKIHIGIITVPEENAQQVCDCLVKSGILAVWNFSPVALQVPEGILVQNENMAASLALLSNHLAKKIKDNT
jgi:redox-sensing transcriptional repressor